MKKLLSVILLAVSLVVSKADGLSLVSCAANTASNLVAGAYVVLNLTVLNATTNIATIKFYDSANTTTTAVKAAYTKYTGYSTNFSVIYTNENSVLVTNTYAGWYTAPVAVDAVTNSLPPIYTIMVPASSSVSRDLTLVTMKGLTAVPNQAVTVATTYKGNP